MRIHKEGYKIIIFSFIILVIIGILVSGIGYRVLYVYCILSLLLFLWIVSFFRYPNRKVEINDNNILSPADGTVVAIEEVEEKEYLHDRRIQVSVFMSPFNVHANWYPVSGSIEYIKYHPGKHLVAYNPKSSFENEMTTIVIRLSDYQIIRLSEKSNKIMIRQIAGIMARRIVNYARQGAEVEQGEQMGFIKFGSRVDILLPLNSTIKVELNQHVRGQKTVIASMNIH